VKFSQALNKEKCQFLGQKLDVK